MLYWHAWLLAQKSRIVPIPGTTKINRMKENMDAMTVHLSMEEVAAWTKVADQIQIIGNRDTPELAKRMAYKINRLS